MSNCRASGVLAHPTSLPSAYGIGDLGAGAFAFLDFLARARQSLWQVLPLTPTGFGNSPYAAPSAFALNPLLIDPEPLREAGLVHPEDLEELTQLPAERVDFGRLVPLKRRLLQRAYEAARHNDGWRLRLADFRERERSWLDDYALFMALRESTEAAWTEWRAPLRDRDPVELERALVELDESVGYHVFGQCLAFEQWARVRERAHALGVRIVGDIPIFVAHDSVDAWANQGLFKLDEVGQPTVVAGVPPDYFSATGQLWGNPLYDWTAMADDGYQWWIARFRQLLRQVDVVRIDHFRGFEAAWEVPAGAETAVDGAWVPGPGGAVFEAVQQVLGGHPPVIAEDLGLITEPVRALLAEQGFPGMKVLQFAFGGGSDNPYLPHSYASSRCVVYTGTHDNDTTRGWFATALPHERDAVCRYLGRDGSDIAWDFIRLALASVAEMAIVPLQDLLDLGSEGRMNTPGRAEGNWEWRVHADQLSEGIADRLGDLADVYGRLP